MQRLQIIPPWECGLITLINSYLAFSSFSFFWDNVIAGFHVTSRRPCWWSKTKRFSPLGTKLYFHGNYSRKNSVVLTPNMATLSSDCKRRIAIRCTSKCEISSWTELFKRFVFHSKSWFYHPAMQSAFLWLSKKDSAYIHTYLYFIYARNLQSSCRAWIEENLCWACARLKFRTQSQ